MSKVRTVRPINKAPNLEPMALSRAISEARGRFSSVPVNPTAIIGQFQVELVAAELQSYRESGTQIRNAVPVLVTPDNIGDATGFVDAFRVFAMGYELDSFKPDGNGVDVWRGRWQSFTLPNLTVTGIRPEGGFRIEDAGHPLGASYCLDCRRRSQVDSGLFGATYSGPRTAKHRARVTAAGGGAYYVSDDCEGWDSVFAAALPETAVQLSRWRTCSHGTAASGIGRVWVSFGFTDEAGSFSWSGAVGFVGEPFRVFEAAVLPGHTPPRVFVEWLCEKFRFPFCVRRHATGAGFNLER